MRRLEKLKENIRLGMLSSEFAFFFREGNWKLKFSFFKVSTRLFISHSSIDKYLNSVQVLWILWLKIMDPFQF